MLQKPNVPVIALEEHYADPELYALFTGLDAATPPHVVEKLKDTGEARLKDMDAAGIDVQVLSHSAPSLQKISSGAVELARRVNDRLAQIVATAPTRYAGFAALPTHDPAAAADELARCVETLGFKGAMIHGLARRAVHRRQALLADLRARRGARRADLPASLDAASGGDRHLL